jgi:hypothetical protein
VFTGFKYGAVEQRPCSERTMSFGMGWRGHREMAVLYGCVLGKSTRGAMTSAGDSSCRCDTWGGF